MLVLEKREIERVGFKNKLKENIAKPKDLWKIFNHLVDLKIPSCSNKFN